MRRRMGADQPESEEGGERGAGSPLRKLHKEALKRRHQVWSGKHDINEAEQGRGDGSE